MNARTFFAALLLALSAAAPVAAQGDEQLTRPPDSITKRSIDAKPPADPPVTVSVSAAGVRFAAQGGARHVRLEVFGADGALVYVSDFRPGGVFDWNLEDARGRRVPDGTYLCAVTLSGVLGRLSMKQGQILLQNGRAHLQLGGGDDDEAGGLVGPRGGGPRKGEPRQSAAPSADAPNATAGRLAKFADAGGSLADSTLSETVGGNVGVGTSAPSAKLDVGANGVLRVQGGPNGANGYPTAGQGFEVAFGTDIAAGNAAPGSGAGASVFQSYSRAANTWRDLWIRGANTAFDANGATALFLKSDGNFGVGTTNPTSKLDVAGDLKVSGNAVVAGNIAAKYQDVAEWVPARRPMRAGTVVVLDATRANSVEPSARAYDTRVAGVVSERPGVILGEAGAGKVMVATTGRVRVRVDATRRAIRVGDLLVTSDRPGAAMKSVPLRASRARLHRPGTIIGKALEPLSGRAGEILVLLSLQ